MVMQRHAQIQLEDLRIRIITELTGLLESNVRNNALTQNLTACISTELEKVALNRIDEKVLNADECMLICQNVTAILQLLAKQTGDNWDLNGARVKSLILEFQDLATQLSTVLIDKGLFEKQSRVLEKIILSHEKVTQWKDFVQQILLEFHDIFPFKFFTIAFSEENGVVLYIYYLSSYSNEIKKKIRSRLINEMVSELGLKADTLMDYNEFEVRSGHTNLDFDNLELVTEIVPTLKKGIGGILAIGYVADYPLGIQEESIIRSLLSVMVMVVGSSRALSHTLSELQYYSEHDPLTGLHNRRFYNDLLEHEIVRSARHQHEFSVLMIDLDNFKYINDSYGHLCGDRVLREIALTMKKCFRKGDVVARFGGDEFSVILPETSNTNALIVAESVRNKIRQLKFYDDEQQRSFQVSASIGLTSYPKDANTINEIVSGADIALYQAKDSGKDFVATLDSANNSIVSKRNLHNLSEDLRQALQEKRLIPYFQPIVNCKDGSVFAFEALARLIRPEGDIIPAGQFIEAADKHGISFELDRVILSKVAHCLAEYISKGNPLPKIFINLSPKEIQHRKILQFAQTLCDELNIPPECLVFEVTEREAVGDMGNMRKFLTKLREKGFAFALDDFGSGYNSFHYLRELHFEYVKIDGDFIVNILNSNVDNALVRALIDLCRELDIKTIAEYVESESILQRLKELGVDYGQGFHLGMPAGTFYQN